MGTCVSTTERNHSWDFSMHFVIYRKFYNTLKILKPSCLTKIPGCIWKERKKKIDKQKITICSKQAHRGEK